LHKLKEAILTAALDAGFVRARILAPFDPMGMGPAVQGPQGNYREGAAALLMTALAYGNEPPEESGGGSAGAEAEITAEAADYALSIAPFARRNYYREAVKRLQGLAAAFRTQFGGVRRDFRILCNSPVPEKPLALACGLGVPGRNGLIITPEAGSLVIIAAMTLPYTLEGDGPIGVDGAVTAGAVPVGEFANGTAAFPLCGQCGSLPPCVSACPTGAARGDGTINLARCIQWYASGKGDAVPAEVAAHWGRRLYGCTGCQDACIRNRRPIPAAVTGEGPFPAWIDGRELLALSDEALKARFKGTAMGLSWLGPAGIRRNIQTALGLSPPT
jgi:epoxyqueuosine reductase